MKIVVDEMPKSAEDCVFGTGIDGLECAINNRASCSSKSCQYLKPITELHAVEYTEKKTISHYGCNTNGEHEKCKACPLTDCKDRNKFWFGSEEDE